jgi:23S rRNA (adenine2503-C2)-methyltransferase
MAWLPLGARGRIGLTFCVQTDIKSLTAEELKAQFQRWGQPAYRVGQLLQWLYVHRVTDWEQMTNLPKSLRERLCAQYSLESLELVRKQGARDATQKFLWRLSDGSLIESVLIPASPALYGEPSDRHTLCVSTQVGCAFGCKFCASGLEGWRRNLSVAEIVDQVLALERWNRDSPRAGENGVRHILGAEEGERAQSAEEGRGGEAAGGAARLVNNLVIMGMGEPLANYANLLKALHILNAPWGGNIGGRRITISTSGLVPQIRKLAEAPAQFRLAISLHGATDAIREKIMPINRKYPLRELVAACEYYQQKTGRMITFEYILIAGVNDAPEQAAPLANLARRLNAKVNLIPYNQVEGLPWQRPTEQAQEAFLEVLKRRKVSATLRREKGLDIDAACGQLRLKTQRPSG